MEITKLVILFNYQKRVLGIMVSIVLLGVSFWIESESLILILRILSGLIILNIIASLVASYILYDHWDLYTLNNLKGIIDWKKTAHAVLVHASFDPLSKTLEKKYPGLHLAVCDIFENRHEKDKGMKISKKYFHLILKKSGFHRTGCLSKTNLRMSFSQ